MRCRAIPIYEWALAFFAACGAACSTPLAPSPLTQCRFPAEAGVAAAPGGRAEVRIVYARGDVMGRRLAASVADGLGRLTGRAFPFAATTAATIDEALCQAAGCPRHAVVVGALASELDAHPPRHDTVRTRRIERAGRSVWLLQGEGALGRQNAAYRFLRALGVRYLHPRQTFAPHRPHLHIGARAERTETPGYARRAWSLATHAPTPAAEAFAGGDTAAAEEILDWLVRNGRTHVAWSALARTPWAHTARVAAEARERGLEPVLRVRLYGAREGRLALFDQAGGAPRGVSEAAAAGIGELAVEVTAPEHRLPGDAALLAMLAAARAAAEAHGVALRLAVRPGDRAARAWALDRKTPWLGAARLEVAAGGLDSVFAESETNAAALALLLGEAGARDTAYAAATQRWPGEAIDVPVFLPALWRARWLDANRLQAYPEVTGITIDDVGWEWGYWANAAVAFEATWAPQLEFEALIEAVFGPLGRNTCDRLTTALAALANAQHGAMAGELRPFVAATAPGAPDPVTAGAPHAALAAFVAGWTALERSLFPVLPRVDPAARPFVQELIDGAVVSRLWMQHAADLVAARRAAAEGDAAAAEGFLQSARGESDLAALIVSAREPDYRYPAARSAGVGPNATAYGYGYLQATRSLDAWVDREARAARAVYQRSAVDGQ